MSDGLRISLQHASICAKRCTDLSDERQRSLSRAVIDALMRLLMSATKQALSKLESRYSQFGFDRGTGRTHAISPAGTYVT